MQILDISSNNISDDVAEAISEYLNYNGMLQELNISHNEITSEGIVKILKALIQIVHYILSTLHTIIIVTKSGLIMNHRDSRSH